MKTYTFKIKMLKKKAEVNEDNIPAIVTCIHCPLEVFFDSFKASKELYEWCKKVVEEDVHFLYVTISDYCSNDGVYIEKDHTLCTVPALLETDNLKSFLTHPMCEGVL